MREISRGLTRPGVRLATFYGAAFATVGIHLPFWPVWLAARGLTATEIGYLLAAALWPRVITNIWVASAADRRGERRRPMIGLALATLIGFLGFGLAETFWPLLLLSVATGATWAAILPLGEALVLKEAKRLHLDYGRLRLWGSVTFIVAAIAAGWGLDIFGAGAVLPLILATIVATLLAVLWLPDSERIAPPANPPKLRDLILRPRFLWFVAAGGLLQVSHAVYYGFATLHWRAAGHSDALIGWLWAEGVIAEVVLFAGAALILRRLSPLSLLTIAGAVTTLRWCALALSTELWVLLPAQALHAVSFGAVHLASVHYLRDSVGPAQQASAQAAYAALGMALPFGLIMPLSGWLFGQVAGAAFWAMAALALVGTLLAAGLAVRSR